VHREVTHPLQLADHPQRGDDDPEVAGDRLLEREQGERCLLDPLAGGVDLGVGGDHALGHVGVTAQESLGGIPDGGLDLLADLGQVREDRVQLLMERFTHGLTVGVESDRTGPTSERAVNTP
jgi:hypothetical protein